MDELLAALRAGAAPGSTTAERHAAAAVCRALLIALETAPGQPLSLLAISAPQAAFAVGQEPHAESPPDPTGEASDAPAGDEWDRGDTQDDEADGLHDEADGVADDADEASAESDVQLCDASEVPPHTAPPARSPTVPAGAATPTPSMPSLDPNAVAALFQAARAMPTEQLLDLAILHMRSRLKEKGVQVPASPPSSVRFQLVPIPSEIRASTAPNYSARAYRPDAR
jgi:hypothetical protein